MNNTVPFFNGERMTKREVLIARDAYAQARYDGKAGWGSGECEREAARRFPLPKITRPRVVKDPHSSQCDWKVICGYLTLRSGPLPANGTFQNYPRSGEGIMPTPERCKLWADLLENPNETVEDECQ